MSEEVKLAATLDAKARQGTGEAKRDQVVKIKPEMLEVDPSFNVRGIGMSEEEYWNKEEVVAHVESIALAYTNGEYVPPIVVKWSPEKQKAIVKDGHHRRRALLLAIERGAPIQYIKVESFSGDESHQQLLMFKSSNSLELSAVEKAEIIHRLDSYGIDHNEIAKKIGKSITYIAYMLKVYDLPIEKKRAIQQGRLTVNAALTPPKEKEKAVVRKSIRAVSNKMIDALTTVKDFTINADESVSIKIPLELWNQFQEATAKAETPKTMEEQKFMENQQALDLSENETA